MSPHPSPLLTLLLASQQASRQASLHPSKFQRLYPRYGVVRWCYSLQPAMLRLKVPASADPSGAKNEGQHEHQPQLFLVVGYNGSSELRISWHQRIIYPPRITICQWQSGGVKNDITMIYALL